MITFSCIIIDDDFLAIKILERYISKIPSLCLVKSYSSPVLALEEINTLKYPIDFVFIDVEMPELNGLALAQQIADKAANIILVSAHLIYAVEGYNIKAKHFLYKPFDLEKLETMVNCMINSLAKEKPYIIVRPGGKIQIQRIYAEDIIAIEGNGNYINIHTTNGVLVSYYKLSDMEHDLKTFFFIKRISKSYIISTKHIEKIENFSIFLKNNLMISVGESYRADFKKTIAKLFH